MNYAQFVCKFVPRSCVSNLLRYTSSVAIFIVSAFSTNIVRQSLCLLQIENVVFLHTLIVIGYEWSREYTDTTERVIDEKPQHTSQTGLSATV